MSFVSSPILLPIEHVQQHAGGECLAACVTMVLNYLDAPIPYKRLLALLHIKRGLGTPFYNIRELEKQGVSVLYKKGTLAELYQHLLNGLPCIVAVQTEQLPYWEGVISGHVVVVVGIDAQHLLVNDPEFASAPLRVKFGDFDLAWLEQGEYYAVLEP